MKKIFLIFSFIIIIFYAIYLYIFPAIVNSVRVNSFIERKTYEKMGIVIKTNNLKLRTKADLTANLFADNIDIYKDDVNIFDTENVNIIFSPLFFGIKDIRISYIYVDNSGMKELLANKKKKRTKKYNLHNLPEIYIDRTEILLKYNDNKTSMITFNNIDTDKFENEPNTISFESIIESPYIKDKIIIKNEKKLKYTNKSFIFENIDINIGKSKLQIDGIVKKKDTNFTIKGKDVPVCDIENYVLYFLKLKNPKKNFLENFYDFSGNADINLKFTKGSIDGTVLMKNLSAKTVLFNIPIKLNDFTGTFEGCEIKAEAYGKLGYEDVYTNFALSHYDKERRVITGEVHSNITNRTVKEYMPNYNVEGSVDATLTYRIEKAIPVITYDAKIKTGSNIQYKNASLGFTEKDRRLFVKTTKMQNKLYIDNYEYSAKYDDKYKNIITGNGLFEKINGKMSPIFISAKTEAPAPISVTGSFGKRLEGGTFNGDLKYDYVKHLLTGNFNLSDSQYKNFKIKTADIKANEKIMEISSDGTFNGSEYKCSINMDNRFRELIRIHNLDLFLDYYATSNKHSSNNVQKLKNSKIIQEAKKLNYIIEQGSIKLNRVKHREAIVENIVVKGSLYNKVINFYTDTAYFAKGNLKASGIFNVSNKNAIIDFSAENVDSNSAAWMLFHLKDQIEGTARAKLHADIHLKEHTMKAKADFAIKNGYLPKLGSTKFILKKSRDNNKSFGLKLADIINIDISDEKPMMSDLSGSFDIINRDLKDINVYSKNKSLSMYIEGDYNIDKENSNIKLWGKYDKNERNKIRVLYIPLSAIMKVVFKNEHSMEINMDKIKKIPPIQADSDDTEIFTVKLTGNPNNGKIKVQLRSIK